MCNTDNEVASKIENFIKTYMSPTVSGSIGGVSGFLVASVVTGDPLLGIATGGAIRGLTSEMVKRRLGDIIDRQISMREKNRVADATYFAIAKIQTKLENNDQLGNLKFFSYDETGSNKPDEVFENFVMKCQREPQEKKIPYMANLFANLIFYQYASNELAHQLINFSETLTYRQLQILQITRRHSSELQRTNLNDKRGVHVDQAQILYEYLSLYHLGLIDFVILRPMTTGGIEPTFGIRDISPEKADVHGMGLLLCELMELDTMPITEFTTIFNTLNNMDVGK